MNLRVLMTGDTVGGVRGYCLDLCRVITGAGGQVLLVTMGPRGGQDFSAEVRDIPGVTLVGTDYKLEWMDEPWSDVRRSGELLLELEQKFRPDVIHLNGFALATLPFQAPKLVVAHSCVLSWWRAVLSDDAPNKYDEYKTRVGDGLRAADLVVAPTAAMLKALEVHYGGGFRTQVVPNGANAEAFQPEPKDDCMCAVGRFWDAAKNLSVVMRAAEGLRFPLLVAGDLTPPQGAGTGPTYVAGSNVHLLGPRSRTEVAQLFARSAIMVHAARYEPFGLAVLEAALSGCALVLSDLPSLRELWADAALFVPVDDEAALHQALATLIDDRAERERLGRRARERASNYSLERFGARYLELYSNLSGNPRAFVAREQTGRRSLHHSTL